MKHLLLVLLLACGSSVIAAEAKKPNVLFIAIDDLRDWVGYLGRNPQARTPNLDRLAKMGMSFTRSYCAAPVCNPSRAALMSGLRPFTSGVYNNNNDWRKVIAEDLMLTSAFRGAGYFVCGAGKIYHESYSRPSEWDDYLIEEGGKGKQRAAELAKEGGIGGIRFAPLDCEDHELHDYRITDYGIAQLGRPHDKPFFLAVGLHKPHMPWNVPQKYCDLFPLVTIQAYLAATAFSDMNLGRLLDALEKSAHRDNTLVVLWCDHGWHLGEKEHWRKFTLWEESARSPLLWVVPGLTQPGSVCERTVDFMTIYPTLTDLCGISTPKHVEGTSIRALLADPTATWDQPGLTTYQYKNHAVRTEGWRYICYANGDEELYDEQADPNEWTNLANNPAHTAIKGELARRLPTHDQPETSAKKPGKEEKPKKKVQ